MCLPNGCAVSEGFRYLIASLTMSRAKKRLERVFVDLVGPNSVAMREGKRDTKVLGEKKSPYSWMHFPASKQGIPRAPESFLADIILKGNTVKIRSNSGFEFNGEFSLLLDRHRIYCESIPRVFVNCVRERVILMPTITQQAARGKAHVLFAGADIPRGLDSS